MTNESLDQSSTTVPESSGPPDPHQPDGLLVALVNISNGTGMEVGVTVYVGSAIVSGLLVSGRTYFELVAQTVEGNGKVADVLAGQFREIAEEYRERERQYLDEDEANDPERDVNTRYIHLRAAVVHAPGVGHPLEQGLWRGRLAAVDGWSFGTFGTRSALGE